MSCNAIVKNLYEPKMDVILTIRSGNRFNKTYVLRSTLQTRTCIGLFEKQNYVLSFIHSFIAMEYAFTLFNRAGDHLADGSFMENQLN